VRAKPFWLALFLLTAVFLLFYVYFTLQPVDVTSAALKYFTREEILFGRQYWRQRQLLFVVSFAIRVSILTAVALGPWGDLLTHRVVRIAQGQKLKAALLFFLILWGILQLASLPLSFYRSYVFEHRWGFSTQTLTGWWADYAKSAALDLVFSAVGALLFFWLLRRWPLSWWLPAGVLMAGWLLIQNLLWPTLVAPLFNRFEPVQDPEVVAMVRQLAERSKIPVQEILVMDASRRTNKANAYFAGIGKTRRIVLYDTLLNNYSQPAVEAVVAHEMAHWKLGHIRIGTLLGILAIFVQFYLLALVLKSSLTYWQLKHYPPQAWAVALLFFLLTSFVGSPLENGVSRYMERAADRESVVLTGDPDGAVALQLNLARQNLSDIMPPPFIEWFAYSHPSTLRRIELLKRGTHR